MLKRGAKQLLAEANAQITAIAAKDALALAGDPNVVFVDVRETVERQKIGGIKGSVHAPRGFLEFHADPESPSHIPALSSGKRLVLYCGGGSRSALAAWMLKKMGFKNVISLAGGYRGWMQSQL